MEDILSIYNKFRTHYYSSSVSKMLPKKEIVEVNFQLISENTQNKPLDNLNWILSNYTKFSQEKDSAKKMRYFLDTFQGLLNQGAYEQAENFASDNLKGLQKKLEANNEKYILLAEYYHKMAWLYDYRTVPEKALEYLNKSEECLLKSKIKTERYEFLLSDIKHFQARSTMLLAVSGQDTDNNINQARDLLNEDLEILLSVSDTYGKEKYSSTVGFRYMWLAYTDIFQSQFSKVNEYISYIKKYWKFTEDQANPGQIASINMVNGIFLISKNEFSEALTLFNESRNIYTNEILYTFGYARAVTGQAICNFCLNNLDLSLKQALEAQTQYRHSLERCLL